MKIAGTVRVTGEGVHFIGNAEEVSYYQENYPEATIMLDPDLTGLEIARVMDEDLENENYHAWSGCYEGLYKLLIEISDETTALQFMERVYESGGLQRLR